jgi:hypothetical protein
MHVIETQGTRRKINVTGQGVSADFLPRNGCLKGMKFKIMEIRRKCDGANCGVARF